MYFTISGLFCIVLLMILFFSKSRIDSKETKLYGFMLISSFFDIILVLAELIITYYFLDDVNMYLVKGLNKIDFIHYIMWPTLLSLYTIYVTYLDEEKYNKAKKIFLTLDIIAILIEFMLPINIISTKEVMGVTGIGPTFVFLISSFYVIVNIIILIKNYKKIKNKKNLPFLFFLIFIIIAMLLRVYNPTLIVIPAIIVYINMIMYFTIENPDIKMIEELTKTKSLVEKNNNDKSIFIFNTTQQIRHPLNMIEQRTEQLLEDELNDDEKEKVIDIRNAQQRIAYILRGVMDVSTIDAKNIKIVKNQYKVANLLTEITLRSKQEATEKGLEFRTNFDEAIPEMLYGDSIRLKQIINALISNAIKYTKEGFVELNVNSIVSFDVCRLVVSVKDSGIGVNAEDINKLFQSKTDENDISDKVDESNVTLDVAKKMVNLIGGTITVRSEKNKGSEFTLIVDQKIASSNDKIDNIINEYKKAEDKIKILLVDDNEEERTLLTKKLGGISKLTIAKNGEEGLKRIRNKEKYDVLLIKESMEKLDAYQTIKKAKILEFVPDKIIVLADNKEEEEKLTINGYNAIFFDTSEQQFIKKLNNIIKK